MNLKFLINYVRTMRCYFYFLVIQLILISILIAYVFIGFEQNRHAETLIFIIECILTIIIVCEVAIRLAMNRKAFFKNIWNIIDLLGVGLILSLFFVLVFFEAADTFDREEDEFIPAVLLAARYATQVVRILLTLKQNHAMMNVANIDIVFDNDKEMSSIVEDHNSNEEFSY